MSLVDLTLLGPTDRVATAIERIRSFEPEDGYYVAFSGGKDSQVVLDLVERSGVKFDAHMNLTTVDPPELLKFVRENYAGRVELHRPEISMYRLIIKNRTPPTRRMRYCCKYLKERGGGGRRVITGIRWSESVRRSKRGLTEACFRDSTRLFVNPIIDWSDAEVWEYIKDFAKMPYCSLYDEGWKRIGCIMCPMTNSSMKKQAERWPKFARMYRRACQKAYEARIEAGRESKGWQNGDDMYDWWVCDQPADNDDPQLFPLDN